jgi:hypothetical protein
VSHVVCFPFCFRFRSRFGLLFLVGAFFGALVVRLGAGGSVQLLGCCVCVCAALGRSVASFLSVLLGAALCGGLVGFRSGAAVVRWRGYVFDGLRQRLRFFIESWRVEQ